MNCFGCGKEAATYECGCRQIMGDELKVLREALRIVKRVASERRSRAAVALGQTGTGWPSKTPYANTEQEAFCYWRGVREGLMGINALAHDALEHGKINHAFRDDDREDRALDAIIVAAARGLNPEDVFRRANETLPELTAEDRAAMDAIPTDAVDHWLAGEVWRDGKWVKNEDAP